VSLLVPLYTLYQCFLFMPKIHYARFAVTSPRTGKLTTCYGLVRCDLPPPLVTVNDVGLSDHHLLEWSVDVAKPTSVVVSVTRRPWHQLDVDVLREALSESRLCQPDCWTDYIAEHLAELYDSEITRVLDNLIPARNVTIRRRPSDPWFDQECRKSKRVARQLERSARSSGTPESIAAWRTERRAYRALLRQKRQHFWHAKIDAEKSSPRQLWRSIDALLGRGRVPPLDAIGAEQFHRYFDDKVASVRSDLPPPALPHHCFGRYLASRRSKTSSQSALMMWLVLSVHCLTKAVHLIRCQPQAQGSCRRRRTFPCAPV